MNLFVHRILSILAVLLLALFLTLPASAPRTTAANTNGTHWQQAEFIRALNNFYAQYFEGPMEIEPNDTYLEANGPLRLGQEYQGYPDDSKDFFSFDLTTPMNVNVNVNNHTGNGVQLQLFYQTIDNRVAWDYTLPYSISLSNAQPGRYYLYIYTQSGFNTNTPYSLWVDGLANHPPVIAQGDSKSLFVSEYNVVYQTNLQATDTNNDPLTWTISAPPEHGAASVSAEGNNVIVGYSAFSGFQGSDSFVVQVSDGKGGLDSITFNVTIQPNGKSFLYIPVLSNRYFHGPMEYEPNNNITQANGPIILNEVYNGFPNDAHDFFYLDLNSPSDIHVRLTNHNGIGVQLQLYYQIIDDSHRVDYDASNDGKRPPYSLAVNASNAQSGRYYIWIFTRANHNSDKLYNLTVSP